ncbi:MAG: glycosyltransferase family 2 protein [Candidatus Colwellbacteria bacterium]|nr:glycosyltransferase family 2 protein [Candidatus Colwellbacteria bacterium]
MKWYLSIGSADDVAPGRDRVFYRALEILPGALIWGTFCSMVLGSLFAPVATAIFIILFDFYWLLKSVYFSWHLRATFRMMKEHIKIDWIKKLDELNLSGSILGIRNWRKDVWHLVLIPFYKESYEILRHTCEALASSGYPTDTMCVVISGEERSGDEARKSGERITQEFQGRFGGFFFTLHHDAPGELAGKGANETWAAREAKKNIIDARHIPYERILATVLDADTVVSKSYFGRLTYAYLTCKKPLRTSFQPIPLFINNIWEAPGLARVISFSSSFWHMMNQMRPERLVSFSSHAFPLKALVEMGFWQTNVVSEDSRIFWQGLLEFDGDWRVEPLLVPVSMDANVAETFWETMKNLYRQQRRWAYGSADIPYFLFGFLKNKRINIRSKFYWTFHLLESFWAWGTNSLLIFLLGWLPILLGSREFNTTVLAYNTPRLTRILLTLAMLGITTSIYLSLMLLPARPPSYGRLHYFYIILQWFLIPITLVLFGSLPAIDAETRLMLGKYMGFWPTPKIRKGIQKEVF